MERCGMELEIVDRVFNEYHFECYGMLRRGMARSGQVGIGKDWLGEELETVDRVLATVPLRVLSKYRQC